MGYCKAAITFVKYVPQVYLNYSRKSTVGWSLANVLLDFTGGTLSLLQIWLNAVALDQNPFTGSGFNIVKFILSVMSIVFDSIFMFQHYVLYRSAWKEHEAKQKAQKQQVDGLVAEGEPEDLQEYPTKM